MFNDRNYLIIKVEELNKVDFSQVLETSSETVRKSVDEIYTFIKWEGEQPSFIGDLIYTDGPYTHSEILQILSGTDWTSPFEEI